MLGADRLLISPKVEIPSTIDRARLTSPERWEVLLCTCSSPVLVLTKIDLLSIAHSI